LTPGPAAGKPAKMRTIPEIAAALLTGVMLTLPIASTAQTAPALKIDVPVVLKDAKVVFNMDHLVFEGATPTGLAYTKRISESFARDKTSWRIISVFHGPAGYMLLNDAAYDRVRKSAGGNPYKPLIAELQKTGVHFEECGETAHLNGWTNADLLPGVQVNSGATLRFIQLAQEGYVQIQP
jgi:intracellular sulfur oxidation DsrE/DsrF family protein